MTTALDVGHLAALALGRRAQQKHGELVGLAQLVLDRHLTSAIELGSGTGATAWFLSELGMAVWSVDVRSPALVRPENHAPRVKFVQASTAEYATHPQLVDLVVIDAGHSYDDVQRDWDLYRDHVRAGGVIAFHDIVKHSWQHDPRGECEVWQLWAELSADESLQTDWLVCEPSGWGGFGFVLF